jgi:transcriptional regulator with GAF, ATPase, and Fis domain/tetratricopeptide (TPR) repeat protein
MRSSIPERFELVHILREDRQSRTFLANDNLLDRERVIVRIIRKDHVQVDREKLIEHFSWLIGVQHSHFATVLDAGLTRKQDLYYVREYVPHSELFSIDPLVATRFLICAVDFLSRHRRAHGAIRPSNIFITTDTFKLTDARLSRLRSTDESDESIHFSAPEVLQGGDITHESDLYSLGAVLYRILTGRHVFEDADHCRLRSKYLSASLQPARYSSPISPPISNIVLELLSRNPAKRTTAFEKLKQAVPCEKVIANRGAFVGQEDVLRQIAETLQKQANTLRVLLVEGETGIGKSRFIRELRLRSVLRGQAFVIWCCTEESSELDPILRGIRQLPRYALDFFQPSNRFDVERYTRAVAEYPATSLHSSEPNYALEKVVSSILGLLSAIAGRTAFVLTIEDIDLADRGTVLFLHQLALRASEIPLTVVLTHRTSEHEPKWIDAMAACLGAGFSRLRLTGLSQQDSEKLVQFLENDRERQLNILHYSAGNPLFIEEYAKNRGSSESGTERIAKAASSMLSSLTTDTRSVLQVLSALQDAVYVKTLATLCEKQVPEVEARLHAAERLGLVKRNDKMVQIPLPVLRASLYDSLPKKTRVRVNRRAFFALKGSEPNTDALADYAFKGRNFVEAAVLYRDLAKRAYRSQKYRAALCHYERLQQCQVYCDEVLSARDKVDLARCYEWLGNHRPARRLYQQLLANESVHKDPELLSLVYVRLAMAFYKMNAKTRIQFQELGIRCLPADSVHLSRRYAQLCVVLLRAGDLVRAEEALQQAEQCVLRQKGDLRLLNPVRAILLSNTGDFRGAARCLLSCTVDEDPLTAGINLAYSLENLGDLNDALKHLSTVQELANANGNVPYYALSLNNRAAIKTKLGEMVEAKQLLSKASDAVQRFQSPSNQFEAVPLAVTLCDAALRNIYLGDYRSAAECLKKASIPNDLLAEMDRMSCKIVRCKFLLEIGLTKNVSDLLQRFGKLTVFNIDFFQIERALIEARLLEIPIKHRSESLLHSLSLSENLGTLYQECELLISLAAVHVELNELRKAAEYSSRALEMANKNGYKIFAARALLMCGVACEKEREKQHFLSDAFQLASEMGLQELIAEAACHIGILNLESGNTVTAREYLIRSTSITARLAEGVPVTARSKYLEKKWRRDAIRALDRCNESIPLHPATVFSADGDKYFAAVYQFTMAASVANSIDGLLSSIENALSTSLSRSAVITLKHPDSSSSIPVRMKLTPETTERIELIRNHAKNRVYFESADDKGKQVSAWIPLKSETCEGGIYLTCRSQSPFTEREIELLTMMGPIASSALKRLETRQAQETELRELSEFHGIIGASKPIREVYSQIQIAARNAATVLIEGESGTGKELVAKAIHAAGPRVKEHFIAVDCSAIPEGLIEAELFGSKKGSYTGAIADRSGLFESAHRGTIFLDEISNTTPLLQAKLLRIIQEREVRRIGETKGRSIDVRLIVASNQSLQALADAGQFRKDLLYRLRVLHIKLPPLRSRQDDIPMLAHAFLKKLNAANKTTKYLAAGVVDHLSIQRFPGNVRELQNAIERAFFLTQGIMITEVPLEGNTAADKVPVEEVQNWFKDISEGRKDFWSAIHNRYKRRDISREKVVALVDFGLRATRGSYKTMVSTFRLKEKEYRRFMDFLRRNDCLLDFRPYRKAAASREN